MSALGQKRTFRSLNNLVGAGEKGARHCEVQRLRCLEIDSQFKFGGQLYGELSRFCTAQNAINVGSRATEQVGKVNSIRDQSTFTRRNTDIIHQRQFVLHREFDNGLTMDSHETVRHSDEAASGLSAKP